MGRSLTSPFHGAVGTVCLKDQKHPFLSALRAGRRRTPSRCPCAPRSCSASAPRGSCFSSSPGPSWSGWSAPSRWSTWGRRRTRSTAPRWRPACGGGGRAPAGGTPPCTSSALHSPRGSPGRRSETLRHEHRRSQNWRGKENSPYIKWLTAVVENL